MLSEGLELLPPSLLRSLEANFGEVLPSTTSVNKPHSPGPIDQGQPCGKAHPALTEDSPEFIAALVALVAWNERGAGPSPAGRPLAGFALPPPFEERCAL
jgi:hypothetical protein